MLDRLAKLAEQWPEEQLRGPPDIDSSREQLCHSGKFLEHGWHISNSI
jgi:hypothetical protein